MIVSRILASFRGQDFPTTERLGRALESIDGELAEAERDRDAATSKVETLERDLARAEAAAGEAQSVLEMATQQCDRLQRRFDDAYDAYLDAAGAMEDGDPYDPALVSEYAA
jgi:chromosome segregation ATPase